jgi:ribosomal 50S subunit-associated protein YjgA (DUF615 family)
MTDRATLRAHVEALYRDVGTVLTVAERRTERDSDYRAMLKRLFQWRGQLAHALALLDAETGTGIEAKTDTNLLQKLAQAGPAPALKDRLNKLADHWEQHETEGFQCVEELRDVVLALLDAETGTAPEQEKPCRHLRKAAYEPVYSLGDESDYSWRCRDCGVLLR